MAELVWFAWALQPTPLLSLVFIRQFTSNVVTEGLLGSIWSRIESLM